jgi:hypothetical protein
MSSGSTSPVSSSTKTAQEGGTTTPSKLAGASLSRSVGDNVPHDPFKDRDFTEVTEEHPIPSLIHTQPSQARTMTIPGIHASHRGEVMSLGNVAPVSPTAESKVKGPTMQSMYRLWKSPILTGQQPGQEAQSSSSSSSSSGRSDATERNHDVVSLSLTPEATSPPPRLVPPPLPPRTVPSNAVRHAPEAADNSAFVPSTSLASEALKSIVSRDETTRGSMELSGTTSGEEAVLSVDPVVQAQEVTTLGVLPVDYRPPLPPRKTHAST